MRLASTPQPGLILKGEIKCLKILLNYVSANPPGKVPYGSPGNFGSRTGDEF